MILSIMKIEGDPDELARKMQSISDVAERKAAQYGGISSTVVRLDDGIKVFNLWETEEGRHQMADDPEIQQVLKDADFPAPAFKGYEVIMHRTVAETPARV
jgi:lipocalin